MNKTAQGFILYLTNNESRCFMVWCGDDGRNAFNIFQLKWQIISFHLINSVMLIKDTTEISLWYYGKMSYLCYPVLMDFPSNICHIWRLDCIINANTGHVFNLCQFLPHPIGKFIIKSYLKGQFVILAPSTALQLQLK